MESYGQFATVYDRLMADMPYEEWIAFAEAVWQQHGKPQKVVDLGCGTGSIAIPLAIKGYQVVGIDLSSDMLAVAAQKLEQQSSVDGNLTLLEQNMSQWELSEKVDSVISFCDCLNYIVDEDDLLATLSATYDQLKQGGSFIFDVHPITRFEQYAADQPFVYDENGISYMWSSEYDEDDHIIEHFLSIFVQEADGRYSRIDEEHVQRAYSSKWLEGALRSVGFTQIHLYSDFQLKAADDHSTRLFFVAIK
ncbi:MAG: class I SAM-dependent methyltransferase [Candidatus Pristimantibacillus lignocellulolyticus]|uniref:Class I SAM-dependent methyltransferase n=1 Tax=Candidatus Pristimantibacillus lignocellulolyticus TaxID=2994561 RepID=A0A9J6ZAT8_9BACL|nr:MAG: class I SAM-dependent methyltransferase [Candidatus Pristimantibacillus lignocellulolyticus]